MGSVLFGAITHYKVNKMDFINAYIRGQLLQSHLKTQQKGIASFSHGIVLDGEDYDIFIRQVRQKYPEIPEPHPNLKFLPYDDAADDYLMLTDVAKGVSLGDVEINAYADADAHSVDSQGQPWRVFEIDPEPKKEEKPPGTFDRMLSRLKKLFRSVF